MRFPKNIGTPWFKRFRRLGERALWKGSTIVGEEERVAEMVEGLQRLMQKARIGKRECIFRRSSVEVAINDNAVGSWKVSVSQLLEVVELEEV